LFCVPDAAVIFKEHLEEKLMQELMAKRPGNRPPSRVAVTSSLVQTRLLLICQAYDPQRLLPDQHSRGRRVGPHGLYRNNHLQIARGSSPYRTRLGGLTHGAVVRGVGAGGGLGLQLEGAAGQLVNPGEMVSAQHSFDVWRYRDVCIEERGAKEAPVVKGGQRVTKKLVVYYAETPGVYTFNAAGSANTE
jgi:hypothetical protein